ncbi:MAG: hypothetical protein H0W64_06435 [Gammaproteobacteria bacterium]|nr:hypothetical protein [Gammaproteobacteria bacterium]
MFRKLKKYDENNLSITANDIAHAAPGTYSKIFNCLLQGYEFFSTPPSFSPKSLREDLIEGGLFVDGHLFTDNFQGEIEVFLLEKLFNAPTNFDEINKAKTTIKKLLKSRNSDCLQLGYFLLLNITGEGLIPGYDTVKNIRLKNSQIIIEVITYQIVPNLNGGFVIPIPGVFVTTIVFDELNEMLKFSQIDFSSPYIKKLFVPIKSTNRDLLEDTSDYEAKKITTLTQTAHPALAKLAKSMLIKLLSLEITFRDPRNLENNATVQDLLFLTRSLADNPLNPTAFLMLNNIINNSNDKFKSQPWPHHFHDELITLREVCHKLQLYTPEITSIQNHPQLKMIPNGQELLYILKNNINDNLTASRNKTFENRNRNIELEIWDFKFKLQSLKFPKTYQIEMMENTAKPEVTAEVEKFHEIYALKETWDNDDLLWEKNAQLYQAREDIIEALKPRQANPQLSFLADIYMTLDTVLRGQVIGLLLTQSQKFSFAHKIFATFAKLVQTPTHASIETLKMLRSLLSQETETITEIVLLENLLKVAGQSGSPISKSLDQLRIKMLELRQDREDLDDHGYKEALLAIINFAADPTTNNQTIFDFYRLYFDVVEQSSKSPLPLKTHVGALLKTIRDAFSTEFITPDHQLKVMPSLNNLLNTLTGYLKNPEKHEQDYFSILNQLKVLPRYKQLLTPFTQCYQPLPVVSFKDRVKKGFTDSFGGNAISQSDSPTVYGYGCEPFAGNIQVNTKMGDRLAYVLPLLGWPRKGRGLDWLSYVAGGWILSPLKNILKLATEFLLFTIQAGFSYLRDISLVHSKNPTYSNSKRFAYAFASKLTGALTNAVTVPLAIVRALISPVRSAHLAYEYGSRVNRAAGLALMSVSMAVSLVGYATLMFFALPLIPFVGIKIIAALGGLMKAGVTTPFIPGALVGTGMAVAVSAYAGLDKIVTPKSAPASPHLDQESSATTHNNMQSGSNTSLLEQMKKGTVRSKAPVVPSACDSNSSKIPSNGSQTSSSLSSSSTFHHSKVNAPREPLDSNNNNVPSNK